MMYTFHSTIHGRCGNQAAPSLPVTFDAASADLERLKRLYFEPDGSFVWAGSFGGSVWQVFGNLYDLGAKLSHVEVNGKCPQPEFDQLLTCFGWPESELMFQHVQQGVWLDEPTFRGEQATKSATS